MIYDYKVDGIPAGSNAGICQTCKFPLDNHGLTYKKDYVECPIDKGDAVLGKGKHEFDSALWNRLMEDAQEDTIDEPVEEPVFTGYSDEDGQYYNDH